MFFREHFDWDAVSGKAETIMIPIHLMKQLLRDYEKVYIWLDPDGAGIRAQQDYLEQYPQLIPIQYPKEIEQKDPTDRYAHLKRSGCKEIALQEIRNLIQ
jgi:DNA primase